MIFKVLIMYARQEYEGVSSIDMDNPTFMDDSHIVKNKPYLP